MAKESANYISLAFGGNWFELTVMCCVIGVAMFIHPAAD